MTQTYWNRVSEFFKLFWIRLVVTKRNFVDFCKVAFHYYSNPLFRKIDLTLLFQYFLNNPYQISKRYLVSKGIEDPDRYGETPLTTLQQIAQQCQISSKDYVFELGSGRGRACFWLHNFIGCKVVGIEQVPEFVEKANYVKERFGVEGVEFRLGNMLQADFSEVTVVYLYGTCLEDSFIKELTHKFTILPSGLKIITVSYPLTDYTEEQVFEVMKRFPAQFTWGEGDVYLHLRK